MNYGGSTGNMSYAFCLCVCWGGGLGMVVIHLQIAAVEKGHDVVFGTYELDIKHSLNPFPKLEIM